jgi:hypothetical protein
MLVRIFAVTLAAVSLVPPLAFAQSTGPGQPDSSMPEQRIQRLPEEIRQKLTEMGFTDVKVVPGSFLVTAKDKQGEPVSMLIGPDSMTMFKPGPDEDNDQATAPPAGNEKPSNIEQ